jgi:putative ABC transport system permease protein
MPFERWLRILRLRLASIVRGGAADRDLGDELHDHVERLTAANLARGMTPAEARRAALLAMDGVEQQKERCRDARGIQTIDELGADLRYALRMCARDRFLTAVAVLSLALAIGANTAIFSLLDSLLLRALPVQDPQRLVIVSSARTGNMSVVGGFPYKVWSEMQRHADLFDGVLAWAPARFDLSAGGETQYVDGLWASGSYFSALGVPAIVGRTFTPEDDRRGGGPDGAVAVISYGFWQRRFGGDPQAIGRTVTLDRVPFKIIGVTPPSFLGPDVGRAFEVTVPLGDDPLISGRETVLDRPYTYYLTIMARLKAGQTADAATTALRLVQPQIREATLPVNAPREAIDRYLAAPLVATPAATGSSPLRRIYERPLVVVMAVVVLVLLIACANIANLLLARASARRHELTVRIALGASRGRLSRQLLTESFMLSAMGAAAGVAVAAWGSHLIVQQLSNHNLTVVLDLTPDWRVMLFTTIVTIATTMLFGVAPAFAVRASAAHARDALRIAAGRGRAAFDHQPADRRLGPASMNALVVAQVALSFVLVVAAGLFVRTFASLVTEQLGFDRDAVLLVNMNVQRAAIPIPQRPAAHEQLRAAVRALPDVASAALSLVTPVSGNGIVPRIEVSGQLPQQDGGFGGNAVMNVVSTSFFDTFGTPLVAGRDFTERDTAAAPLVAVVSQKLARTFLGNASPLGHTVKIQLGAAPAEVEIVGVAGDAAYRSVREGIRPTIYVPLAQFPNQPGGLASIMLSVRARQQSPQRLAREIAAAIAAANPNVAITLLPLAQQVDASLMQERIVAMLAGFFGTLALLLAAIGLYGVTSYAVTRRRAELGIRMALGAAPGGVVRLVLARVALLVGVGIAAGAGLSV